MSLKALLKAPLVGSFFLSILSSPLSFLSKMGCKMSWTKRGGDLPHLNTSPRAPVGATKKHIVHRDMLHQNDTFLTLTQTKDPQPVKGIV